MFNDAFSTTLNLIADYLQLKDDNPFRIRAFLRAAETIGNYSVDISKLSREELLAIPGIGKGIIDLLEEFKSTGSVKDLEKFKKEFPEGVLQMTKIPGLGPKRAGFLFKELKIDTLAKLEEAAKAGRIQMLKGFGEKIEQSLLHSMSYTQEHSKRVLLYEALKTAESIERELSNSAHINQLILAGSARRWKETIGDIDFLCTSKNPEKAIEDFIRKTVHIKILAQGSTKASVILRNQLQCDFRVVDPKSYGAALLYFTGSKEHNVRLREIAQQKKLTLNEYGLFKVSDIKQKSPVASKTEEDIYRALGMDWIPPELREDRGEIQAAQQKKLPKLIEESDVLGDFHNHTDQSDGANTLEEMVEGAKARGWQWIFSADHSPSLVIANGLPVPALRKKIKQVREINDRESKFGVYCSTEVDILKDGSIDYPDNVLDELDCVVASVHMRHKENEQQMTDRLCKAMSNPHVDIIGHLTGRRIGKRDGYALNIEKIFETAKKTNTVLEINGQPERSELSDVYVRRAIELGIPLCLNTDAHSVKTLDYMRLAVHIARRGWAEATHILNTKNEKSILEWLK